MVHIELNERHTMNQQLQTVLDALEGVHLGEHAGGVDEAISIVKQMMQAEPVVWAWRSAFDGEIYDIIVPEEHAREEGKYTLPLYTHPAPQVAQPVRESLTDENIQKVFSTVYANGFNGRDLETAFARAIEAAHGIRKTT
jgi:hypothetical protein